MDYCDKMAEIAEKEAMADMAKREVETECSFCGLLAKDVEFMVAGPGDVYICSECIETCTGMLEEYRSRKVKV